MSNSAISDAEQKVSAVVTRCAADYAGVALQGKQVIECGNRVPGLDCSATNCPFDIGSGAVAIE